MKVYSHWTDDNDGTLERTFFARKAQQETHSRMAIKAGHRVLAMGEYTINNADDLADFLNARNGCTTYDLAEEFILAGQLQRAQPTTPTLEDMLG